MDCDRFIINLSAALDGELTPKEREELEGHLSACPACREELALLRESAEVLGLLAREAPLRNLWPAISRELGLAQRERREEVANLARLVFKRPLPAAAALMACLIAALFGYWRSAVGPRGSAVVGRGSCVVGRASLDTDKVLESPIIMAGSWRGLLLPARKEPGQSKEETRGIDSSQGPGQSPTILT